MLGTGVVFIYFGDLNWLLRQWSHAPEDLLSIAGRKQINDVGRGRERNRSIEN